MSAQFDPYHRWLGIPPEKQPTNHYALLAIEPFEGNADVIESAADQRMAHLRNFQAGEHSDLSQKLLNEVAAAKICLLNPDKKAVYDRKLREKIEAARPVVPKAVPAKLKPAGPSVHVETGEETSVAALVRRRRSQLGPIVGGGVIAAAVIGGLILWALNSGDRPADDDKDVAQQGNTTAPSDPAAVGEEDPDGVVPPGPVDTPPGDVPPNDANDPGNTPPEDAPTDPADPTVPPEGDPPADPPGTTPPEDATDPPPTDPVQLPPEDPPLRQPLPSSTAQAAVTRQLDEIYKFAELKTPAKKLTLAGQLLKLAGEAKETPAEQVVLLRKAMELAAAGGDADVMLGAIDAIAVDFEVDALAVKQKILPQVAQAATDVAKLALLAEGSLAVVDEATACHRYDVAHAVIEAAYRACQRAEGREYRKQIYDRRKEVQKLHATWQQFQEALVTLNTTPDDAEANLAVGRWYCFTLGDWRQALPHLSKCSDAALKSAAALELATPADTAQQVAAGDAWFAAAEGAADELKSALLHRAGHWYEQARPAVKSVLLKGKLDQRLAEIAKVERPGTQVAAVTSLPGSDQTNPQPPSQTSGEIKRGQWVDLLKAVDIDRDPVAGTWTRTGEAVAMAARHNESRLGLPARLEGSYELAVEFTPHSVKGVVIILPAGHEQCLLLFGWDRVTGLSLIDGATVFRNPSARKLGALQTGRRYGALVRVQLAGENATIAVSLNGTGVVSWTGKQASLSLPKQWRLAERDQPGLGAGKIPVTFHSARLRLLSGKGLLSGKATWARPPGAQPGGGAASE